ncbi:hypothetical protein QTV44_000522 [Vibrio vulnificus]|nr:hypothetical protein [Vibrio vulnificus]
MKDELIVGFAYADIPAKQIFTIEQYEAKALINEFCTKKMSPKEKKYLKGKIL